MPFVRCRPTHPDPNTLPNTRPRTPPIVIWKATIGEVLCPVFMGTALKNSGVQTLLDGVIDYLPSPSDVTNKARCSPDNAVVITVGIELFTRC